MGGHSLEVGLDAGQVQGWGERPADGCGVPAGQRVARVAAPDAKIVGLFGEAKIGNIY